MYQIYCATHIESGKCYVGQTCVGIGKRWNLHKSRAKRGYPHHLYCAIRKYGAQYFDVQELGRVETREDADNLEKLWIVCLRATEPEFGYNNTFGGEGGKKTPAGIEKQRQKMLGRKSSPEAKQKLSASLRKAWQEGRHTGTKGKKLVFSIRPDRNDDKHPAFRHDVKNEDLIALRNKGMLVREIADHFGVNKCTVERRFKKLGLTFPPVRARSEETKKKIGRAFRGVKRSEEFCKKTSNATKLWWAKRKAEQSWPCLTTA